MEGPSGTAIRVLHVDDEPDLADLVATYLEREHEAITVETETDARAGLERLDAERVDCVVSDYQMPEMDGLEFLEAVREREPDLPFVLFTGHGSEEIASEAISAGVTDYLQKEAGTDQYAVLANRIVNAVEKRRAERDVERNEARLRQIIDLLPQYVFVKDEEGRYLLANEAIAEAYGRPPEEVEGRTDQELLPSTDDARQFRRDDLEVIESGEPKYIPRETITEVSGDERVLETRKIPFEPAKTELRAVLGVAADITEREEREAELERYQTIVEASGDPVYTLDAEGRFTFVNERVEEVTGYTSEELLGEPATYVMAEEDFQQGTEVIQEILADPDRSRGTFEMEVTTADGELRLYENHLAILPFEEEFRGTTGVIRDITEREEREAELERYQTIVEASGDPVYTLDADGHLTFANEQFARMVGWDLEDLVGTHPEEFLAEGDVERGMEVIEELRETPDRDQAILELTVVTAEGKEIPSEFHIALLPGEEYRGTTGIIRDVSERKEREEELERQNERLDEFARVVAHDLRNPLHVAMGRLELARETGADEHFEKVEVAHDRMATLIEDLLTLAREGIAVSELEPVSLEAVVEEAWANSETEDAGLEVVEDQRVRASHAQLCQLLENVFRNAVDHAGPDVSVRVGPLAEGFFVEDDGPGIPPDDRERVFDAGYSGADHSGLGLNIVERIVEAHGWTVEAVEGSEGGARFEVTGVESV